MKNKAFVNLWRAILVILGFSFITCLIFFKIFTKGFYPVPGDLLVSFYFPWYSGGWEGYDSWTTRKELLAADAVRQIYLWKEFAADQFKNGQFPLWNPYTFSGQPLAANFQSSAYYPANVFYFLTDARVAWVILIVLQPFIAGIFMFLALRSFKIFRIPSIFAAISFMFSSYFITWLENGNISHSYLWLPLAIWSINRYFDSSKIRYYLILTFSFVMSILAGHPQTVIYIFLATTAFWIYKIFETRKSKLQSIAIYLSSIFLTFLITAIQLVPTMDFYKDSPISQPFAKSVFDEFILPYQNLVTFLVPDFFGHPASNNFWSKNYGDFTPYFGVIPFVFSIWAIVKLWNKNFIKFATFVSTLFIFAAVAGPITWFIKIFEIPLLDATSPARFISISIFFLIILSGFGLSDLIANIRSTQYLKKFTQFLIFWGVVYLGLWVVVFAVPKLFGLDETGLENFLVTRRNLILPSVMFFTFAAGVTVYSILLRLKITFRDIPAKLLISGIFFATIFGGIFYSNKFLPTAPLKFIFPEHPIFNWLQNNAQIYRFYGGGTAKIDQNHPIHYEVFGAEGYDTLRLKRYAELLISANNKGLIPDAYSRSDAFFPNIENGYRKRLFELLGVKYLLDKEDNPKSGSDWHYERFPDDKVVGEWQEGKFQIYKREDVLPRIFLTTNYQIIKDKGEILRKIYDPSFDLTNLILEEEITLNMEEKKPITLPALEKYESNLVVVKTTSDVNSLLFLSDAYSKDWKSFVDGQEVYLHRAHYALRAVEVPKGSHRVTFKYQPVSHAIGLIITLFSVLIIGFLIIFAIRFKKF